MTHYITAEFMTRVLDTHPAQPGQIVTIAGSRYLITKFDTTEQRYSAEKEPRNMHGHVLWRATCSCGYSSALGTRHKETATEMAYSHYMRSHLMPSIIGTPTSPIVEWSGVEPYWHD